MREEATPTVQPPVDLASTALPPKVLGPVDRPPKVLAQTGVPATIPHLSPGEPSEVRLPLALRAGASVVLGTLLAALVVLLVAPSLLGRPDAPDTLPSLIAIAMSIASVVLLVGCWRVRLTATPDEVVRVRLFSDAHTISRVHARRIEISTPLAEPSVGTASTSMLPTIVLSGPRDVTITSRESRREADALLPHLLAWSRQRPELVKDAHTLRFLTAYARTTY